MDIVKLIVEDTTKTGLEKVRLIKDTLRKMGQVGCRRDSKSQQAINFHNRLRDYYDDLDEDVQDYLDWYLEVHGW